MGRPLFTSRFYLSQGGPDWRLPDLQRAGRRTRAAPNFLQESYVHDCRLPRSLPITIFRTHKLLFLFLVASSWLQTPPVSTSMSGVHSHCLAGPTKLCAPAISSSIPCTPAISSSEPVTRQSQIPIPVHSLVWHLPLWCFGGE